MLGVKTYSKEYVAQARARTAADIEAFKTAGAGPDLEHRYFNNLVLALELSFVHRLRGVEGKDGNPLNEVRVLAQSLMENNGVLTVDKTIKWAPDTSVLGYAPGDAIRIGAADFARLAEAFFAGIESRFMA